MLTSAADMMAALWEGAFLGVVLYEGPSELDGGPVVAVATRIANPSRNPKTGAGMVQTFIVRADLNPIAAARTGEDASVCGDCAARPTAGGYCYVNVAWSVHSVWDAYRRGRYARPGADYDPALLPGLLADRDVRLGAYGDAAAVPFDVWRAVLARTRSRNGYTHQWRTRPELRAYCMASADTPEEADEARAAGWRVFRTRLAGEPLRAREVPCHAAAEAGRRTHCEACRACGGLSSKAKADLTIVAHGPRSGRYVLWRTGRPSGGGGAGPDGSALPSARRPVMPLLRGGGSDEEAGWAAR